MSTNDNKRFSDWEDVDCNECEHWWTNSCDGVPEAQKRPCTAFKASRSVVIPQEIKALRTKIKGIVGALIFLSVAQVIIFWLIWFVISH